MLSTAPENAGGLGGDCGDLFVQEGQHLYLFLQLEGKDLKNNTLRLSTPL